MDTFSTPKNRLKVAAPLVKERSVAHGQTITAMQCLIDIMGSFATASGAATRLQVNNREFTLFAIIGRT